MEGSKAWASANGFDLPDIQVDLGCLMRYVFKSPRKQLVLASFGILLAEDVTLSMTLTFASFWGAYNILQFYMGPEMSNFVHWFFGICFTKVGRDLKRLSHNLGHKHFFIYIVSSPVITLALIGPALWKKFDWFCIFSGSESKHEAIVLQHHRHPVHSLQGGRQVQAPALLSLFLPLCLDWEAQVPHAGLEHCLWI